MAAFTRISGPILLFIICLIFHETTYAANATRMLGFSARDSAIAGATTALPKDTSCGFSYFITKNLSLDFVWERHFKGTQTDDGSGDIYSMNGIGTKITSAADVLSAGLSYKF